MKTNTNNKKDRSYKIGDVWAYKIEGKEYGKLEGRYLIFRKIGEYGENRIYENPIVYVQITENSQLPKTEEDLNKLEYVIISNEGNVRHIYRMVLENTPKKKKGEYLIYIGNFPNLITPEDEYIEDIRICICKYSIKRSKYIIERFKHLGTNKKPIYYEVDPKNISDSHIRFLMRVQYYKKVLKIEPPEEAIVKNDPLLYISLVDSLMVGGFVRNPVGFVNEEIKQEAYKRIEQLRKIVNSSENEDKEERLKILDEFEEKVKQYTGSIFVLNTNVNSNSNNNY